MSIAVDCAEQMTDKPELEGDSHGQSSADGMQSTILEGKRVGWACELLWWLFCMLNLPGVGRLQEAELSDDQIASAKLQMQSVVAVSLIAAWIME